MKFQTFLIEVLLFILDTLTASVAGSAAVPAEAEGTETEVSASAAEQGASGVPTETLKVVPMIGNQPIPCGELVGEALSLISVKNLNKDSDRERIGERYSFRNLRFPDVTNVRDQQEKPINDEPEANEAHHLDKINRFDAAHDAILLHFHYVEEKMDEAHNSVLKWNKKGQLKKAISAANELFPDLRELCDNAVNIKDLYKEIYPLFLTRKLIKKLACAIEARKVLHSRIHNCGKAFGYDDLLQWLCDNAELAGDTA